MTATFGRSTWNVGFPWTIISNKMLIFIKDSSQWHSQRNICYSPLVSITNQFGIAAGLMMLIIALTFRLCIRCFYELFYVMHVLFVFAILITLYAPTVDQDVHISRRHHLCWPVCTGQGDQHHQVRLLQPWNHRSGCPTPRRKYSDLFKPESAWRHCRIACFPLVPTCPSPCSPILAR
jgi:hypothetical protein